MKKIYVAFLAIFLSIGAMAQHKDSESLLDRLEWDDKMLNIMLDTRVDFQSSLSNDGDLNDLSFRGQTFKLWVVGEIIPGIRYRVRHRLNRPQTPLREGYSGATDQAWLAFDLGKNWTITVGKQSVQFGTFEYDYNPADIYLSTMCFDDLDAYKTGINVAYKFLGQTVHLQVVNSDAPQFASAEYASKALSINALWEGNLFDGLIKTRWGYGLFQHDDKKFYNWVTPGTQVNLGKFAVEADYYFGYRDMDYSGLINDPLLVTGSRYVRDQSVSLNLKYDLGAWKPFIKGTWNQRYDEDFNDKAYENWGIQAVVEFYPFANSLVKDLRFHAMYSYNNTNFKGVFDNLDNVGTHALLFGVRWLFKAK